jgi:hypothetical protein
VSRRLNIVCLIFKIRTFFITTFFAWLLVRIYILAICDKSCMTASFHYAGKLGPTQLALRLHMLLESLFQARKSSGHIYVWYLLNCSDSVICFELFRQCDIFWTVPTVWYFLNCCDSVIFFEMFRQCEILLTVPTVWYFFNCSDSVIFVFFHCIPLLARKVHYCALYNSSYLPIELY